MFYCERTELFMKRKKLGLLRALLLASLLLTSLVSCTLNTSSNAGGPPTTVTIWTYYNGTAKDSFDSLVEEFNKTVGKEKNIVIDAYSQGDVNQLADAVFAAANEDVGAKPMPDVFAAYADSAYKIEQLGLLVDLDTYFTKEELSLFHPNFLEDGRFGKDNALKIIPIAKSSEIIFLNKTDFDKFSQATNADYNKFSTWEGLAELAAQYYDWTDAKTPELNDGKALFGFDAMANYMFVGAKQLGKEIFQVSNTTVTVDLPKDIAKKLWDNFYIPFVKGHYAAIGRFRSDDAKTGDLLAYSGSTAGAPYFPKQIETSTDNAYPIECSAFPLPVFENAAPVAVHQGAGMAVAKSDTEHENAAVVFLKWFTDVKPNSSFAVKTGYLPVKTEVLNLDSYNATSKELFGENENPATLTCANATYSMFEKYSMYANKPFATSYEARKVLQNSLHDFSKQDLEKISSEISEENPKETVLKNYITDENFDKWYTSFIAELNQTMQK